MLQICFRVYDIGNYEILTCNYSLLFSNGFALNKHELVNGMRLDQIEAKYAAVFTVKEKPPYKSNTFMAVLLFLVEAGCTRSNFIKGLKLIEDYMQVGRY